MRCAWRLSQRSVFRKLKCVWSTHHVTRQRHSDVTWRQNQEQSHLERRGTVWIGAARCGSARAVRAVSGSRESCRTVPRVATTKRENNTEKKNRGVEARAVMRVAIRVTTRGWLPLKGWSRTKKPCPPRVPAASRPCPGRSLPGCVLLIKTERHSTKRLSDRTSSSITLPRVSPPPGAPHLTPSVTRTRQLFATALFSH